MYRSITAILLIVSATPLFAQDLTTRLKQLPTPAQQLDNEATQRALCRSVWDGKGTYLALWIAFGSGKGADLGLTPAQIERLGAGLLQEEFNRKKSTGDPEIAAAVKAVEQARPKDDPGLEKASEQQKKAYLDAELRLPTLMYENAQKEVEKTLTPEQTRKARSLELQILTGAGFPNPGMYESLGLSGDQKEKMTTIRQKMEPEFKKFLDGLAAVSKERDRLTREYLTSALSGKETISDEEWSKALRDVAKQVSENESLRKLQVDNTDQGLGLAARLQFELTEVLTKEQTTEMDKLLADTPDFAKNLIAAIKKQREEQRKTDGWRPGPDSWHPGQGVPPGFMKEDKTASL